ncbi:MAG TPA: hypothetical protein VF920_15935, partial [Dongiaceae bacterium]
MPAGIDDADVDRDDLDTGAKVRLLSLLSGGERDRRSQDDRWHDRESPTPGNTRKRPHSLLLRPWNGNSDYGGRR